MLSEDILDAIDKLITDYKSYDGDYCDDREAFIECLTRLLMFAQRVARPDAAPVYDLCRTHIIAML